jgi:hypothetical protein
MNACMCACVHARMLVCACDMAYMYTCSHAVAHTYAQTPCIDIPVDSYIGTLPEHQIGERNDDGTNEGVGLIARI